MLHEGTVTRQMLQNVLQKYEIALMRTKMMRLPQSAAHYALRLIRYKEERKW